MLRMLSSGIYSDKIAAFIRELSTNAYDAMVENKTIKDKTFYVHLPTKLEPWFMIRDYGNGLDSEGMENNFSNFGDGTKAGSNEYNGAFGLGSKSPLSYVRDFTITSCNKGSKTFYNYGKNDEDVPMLSTAYSIPSDEPSGLEIQIAIQSMDIPEVIRKAELIYRYFDKKPETNVELEYHSLEKIIEGDGWYVTHNDKRNGYEVTTPTRVVMGNVAYPITNASGYIYPLSSIPFIIQAEIGDVQMTPSRESLEMTPKTIKYLEDKFAKIKVELSANVESKLDQKLNDFNKVIQALSLIKLLPRSIRKDIKVGNYSISDNRWDSIFKIPTDIENQCSFRILCDNPTYSDKKNEQVIGGWRPKESNDYVFLVVDKSNRVQTVIDDLKRKHKYVYVLRFAPKTPDADIIKIRDKFFKSCGNPDYILASAEVAKLPPLVKAPKGTGTTTPVKRLTGVIRGIELYSQQHGGLYQKGNLVVHPDDAGDYYYVKMYNGNTKDHNNQDTWRYTAVLSKVLDIFVESLGKKSITIIGITSQYYEKAEKDSRFKCLFNSIIETKLKVSWLIDKASIDFLAGIQINSNIRKVVDKKKSSELLDLIKLRDKYSYGNYQDTYKALGFTIVPEDAVDIVKYKEKVQKYMYLNYLSYNAPDELVEFLVDLIEENKLKIKDKNDKDKS